MTALQELSDILGFKIISVRRQPQPLPDEINILHMPATQGWRIGLSDGRVLWLDSSQDIRVPHRLNAWRVIASHNPELPALTRGQVRRVLSLMHEINDEHSKVNGVAP